MAGDGDGDGDDEISLREWMATFATCESSFNTAKFAFLAGRKSLNPRLTALESERDGLKVEAAPHTGFCASNSMNPKPCDCWKAAALNSK